MWVISSWEENLFGVPQESILWPLFELSQTDFACYAGNNTPYVEANNIDEVI